MDYKSIIVILILLSSPCLAQTAFDPLFLSVGARALGMGRASAAAVVDGDTLFNNPAGLGEIDHFKFTSMSGNLLEDVNFLSIGGVYPLGKQAAVGIGYAGAFVSGLELRNAAGTFSRKASWGNSVILATFGKKIAEKTSLGINLKYFLIDGTEIDDGDGRGWNVDLGILQCGLGWFNLGIVGRNVLGSGKIQYQNGESETLPQSVAVGARMYLLGGGMGAFAVSPIELSLLADLTLPLQSSFPRTLHAGLEFSPLPALTLRAGIDQDPKPGGIQSNPSAGVTLQLGGLGFHYAYHPFLDFAENAAHFFSFTFDERGWIPEELPDTFLGRN